MLLLFVVFRSEQTVEQHISTVCAISLELMNTLILTETWQSTNIPCARGKASVTVINSSPPVLPFTISQDITISS